MILGIYPTAVIFAEGWYLFESKTGKREVSFTENLWLRMPSPRCGNTLLAESGWSDGRGISRKSFTHRSTHPQRRKTALKICRGKAQGTLSYKLSLLAEKKTKIFSALNA